MLSIVSVFQKQQPNVSKLTNSCSSRALWVSVMFVKACLGEFRVQQECAGKCFVKTLQGKPGGAKAKVKVDGNALLSFYLYKL